MNLVIEFPRLREWEFRDAAQHIVVEVFVRVVSSDKVAKFFGSLAVIHDELERDLKRFLMKGNALDGARRVSCFGESFADFFAAILVGRKVNMFAPSDVVGVEEEGLKFDLILPLKGAVVKNFYFKCINIREEIRSERAVEERAERKYWIVSLASCREKNASLLRNIEVITESSMEDVHMISKRFFVKLGVETLYVLVVKELSFCLFERIL